MFRKTLERANAGLSKSLILLIKVYQFCLSPLLGPHCRFFPSCSDYAKESIDRFGVVHGTLLTLGRLCRCAPWSQGGVDEVPHRE